MLGTRPVGLLGLAYSEGRAFTHEQLEFLQALGQQAALAVQANHLAQVARREAEQAATLDERNRLAREIHDTLAQSFTGVIVQLEAARRAIDEEPGAVRAALTRAGASARDGLTEARRSVWALRPQALDQADLVAALRRLVDQTAENTSTALTFQLDGTLTPLLDTVEVQLLRIAQEALHNALRHAQARSVVIQLSFQEASTEPLVRLRVADNGVGFDSARPAYGMGFGLISMHDRARQIGALLTVTSRLGQGTELVVTLPSKDGCSGATGHET